ncbi:MAG: SpoIID/LytB domain-containing protein [Cyanobacteria bacterium P01_F01_bin.42]
MSMKQVDLPKLQQSAISPVEKTNAEGKAELPQLPPSQVTTAIKAQPLEDSVGRSPTSNAAPISKATPNAPEPEARAKSETQPSQPSTNAQRPETEKKAALTMRSFNPAGASDVPDVPIRVAIARDAQRLTVATAETGLITNSQGQVLGRTSPRGAIEVSTDAEGIRVGVIQSQQPLWIRPGRDQDLVFVNGSWYRGAVQLIPDEGKILAVNHVEMQPYLYSVVGAEMYHSWPAAALKAQAIAARSYALVHIVRPASPHFDLGSTQRWQAYKGVASEADSTLSAVDQTRGIVISHNGGIVESLYASSADLVREAHGGFGMSQYGARDLAQQSLNYRQILSRFYTGTQLSLLQDKYPKKSAEEIDILTIKFTTHLL